PELPPASFSANGFGTTMVSLTGGNPVNSGVRQLSSRRRSNMRCLLLRIMPFVLAGTSIAAQQAAKSQEPSITLPPSLTRVLTDYDRGWKAGDAAALAQ